jgi:hypothetical protein
MCPISRSFLHHAARLPAVDYDNRDDAVDRKQAVGTIVFALYLVAMGVILFMDDHGLWEWAWASTTLGILLLVPARVGNLLVRFGLAMIVAISLLLLFGAGQLL